MSDEAQVEAATLAEAGKMGWLPKEQYKGNPDTWVDAKTYVEKGQAILPIVQATNKSLREDNARLKAAAMAAEAAIVEMRESVSALEEFHSEETERKVKAAREKVIAELAVANEAGDHVAAATLTGELVALDTKTNAAVPVKETPAPAKVVDHTQTPDFLAFRAENTWFGDANDPINRRKTTLAIALANELRMDPANAGLIGRPFMDKVLAALDEVMPGARGNAARVGETRTNGGGNGGGGGGRSYADLPQEAKDACAKQAARLVGPNKIHKTQESWQKRYAEIYFKDQS